MPSWLDGHVSSEGDRCRSSVFFWAEPFSKGTFAAAALKGTNSTCILRSYTHPSGSHKPDTRGMETATLRRISGQVRGGLSSAHSVLQPSKLLECMSTNQFN